MKFLLDAIRAWKFYRKKHVTPDEFISVIEEKVWKHKIDENSAAWLRDYPLVVDILHKMVCGRLVTGDDYERDRKIWFALIDSMLMHTPSLSKDVLNQESDDKVFKDILADFSDTHPDAAMIIIRGVNAFVGEIE